MSSLIVESVGHATVQDLGRPGYAHFGIPMNGAADQHSARMANILVGNADGAPLIEVSGSSVTFLVRAPLLIAVAGTIDWLTVDGQRQPAHQPLAVFGGSRVHVPAPEGLRNYVAINGQIVSERVFGSVAPDRLMGVGRHLRAGEELAIESRFDGDENSHWGLLFRFATARPRSDGRVDVTPGPDLHRMVDGAAVLSAGYEVSPQSDHIGLRLLGPRIEQHDQGEILSRGVPIGAVEAPPTGGLIVLLRGRMLTAGYPVIAVVTTASLDRLGQASPGDMLTFALREAADAASDLQRAERELEALAIRVRAAFAAAGLSALLPIPA